MQPQTNDTEDRGCERVALDVRGLGTFTQLSGETRRFRKEILRVGQWIHPATGELLDFSRDFLATLVRETTRWIGLGNKVWFPAGHTSDPRDNMGFWSGFDLEGDRVVGVLEVQDDEIANKVGTTIQDVSAGIWWDARASSGETFDAVIEHVCGTPCPVIPAQENFVRLAREATSMSEKKIQLDLAAAIREILKLPSDATDEAIVDAVRTRCAEANADTEDDEENEGAEALATLSRQVEQLRTENKRIRSRAAHEKVDLARRRSAELGSPIDEDVRQEALALLERGDESSERLANRLLELALRPTSAPGKPLPNPSTGVDDRAELERHASLERAYLSQGLKVEKDAKGRITHVTRPEAGKK